MVRKIPEMSALGRAWSRPRRLGIREFAERYITLPESYSQAGRLDLGVSRYLIEPLRAFACAETEEVDVLKAVKMGGTLIAECAIAYALTAMPGPVQWTMQTDDDAKEHMKGRGWAFLKSIRPIRDMLPVGRRHDITDTTVYFPTFAMWVDGASRNNAQGKDIRIKVNSEVWLWKQGLHSQFRKRTTAFASQGLAKILNESQASVAGHDWERSWLSTDQCLWSAPCPHCGSVRPLSFFGRMEDDAETFANVVWDKECERENGTFDEDRLRRSTRYRCSMCGKESPDTGKTRLHWNDNGEYVAQRAGAGKKHRGFHFNSLPKLTMADLAAEFRHAVEAKKRGDISALRDFHMQRLALFWRDEEQVEKIEIKSNGFTLRDISKDPLRKIDNECERTMYVDCQRDHYWAIVEAWRADGSSRIMYRSRLVTDDAIEEVRACYGVAARLTFLDAQHDTGRIYDLCAKRGYTALHGSGKDGFIHGEGKAKHKKLYSKRGVAQAPHGGAVNYFFWASDPCKDMLHAALVGTGDRIEIPDDVDAQPTGEPERFRFSAQVNSEQKLERINKATGQNEFRWVKKGENHWWDCLAMGRAVGVMLRIIRGIERADTNAQATPEVDATENGNGNTGDL